MTSFQDPLGHSPSDLLSLGRTAVDSKPLERPMNFLQKLGYGAGYFPDKTVRLLGRTFTDNPIYRQNSVDYWTQVGFHNLFSDIGVNSENLGTAGPVLAGILGLGADILNPADPLNWLGVGALTRSGKAGHALAVAEEFGVAETVLKGGKDVVQINKASALKKIEELTQNYEKVQALGNASRDTLKAAAENLKVAKNSLREIDNTNELLHTLQSKGATIEDLRLGQTFVDRVRKGQQTGIGLQRYHIPFTAHKLGGPEGIVNFGPKALQASVADVAGKFLGGSKDLLKAGAIGVVKSASKTLARDIQAAQKFAGPQTAIRRAFQKGVGDINEMKDILTNLANRFNLSEAEFNEVLDGIENSYLTQKLVAREAINDIAKKNPETFAPIKQAVKFGPLGSATKEDELLVSPSGINTQEDVGRALNQLNDSAKYPSWTDKTNKRITLTGDYVAIQVPNRKQNFQFANDLNEIYGAPVYHKIKTKEGSTFLAKKIPGGRLANDKLGFGPDHFHNMSALLAQLTNKKLALKELTLQDVLINPHGGVQLIDPSKIVKVADEGTALAQNRLVLENFLKDFTGNPSGLIGQSPFLKSVEAARKAPVITKVKSLSQTGGNTINVNSLLNQAVNAQIERAYIDALNTGQDLNTSGILQTREDFERANGITGEINKIKAQALKGEVPAIDPVIISKDLDNNLYIVDGHERAVAAQLMGLDVIPIIERAGLGESLDLTKPYYTGHFFTVPEAFIADGGSAIEHLSDQTKSFLSEDYKIISIDGQFYQVAENSLETGSSNAMLEQLSNMVKLGLSDGRTKAYRPQLMLRGLIDHFGSSAAAMAGMAELANSSKSLGEFASKLEPLLGRIANVEKIGHPLLQVEANTIWNNLRTASSGVLDELAANGILTKSTISSSKHIDLANQFNKATVITLNKDKNTLNFYNKFQPLADLQKTAKGYFNKLGGADDIDPFGRVNLIGSDESVSLKVSSFAEHTNPEIATLVKTPVKAAISKEELDRLRVEHQILKNPKPNEVPYLHAGIAIPNDRLPSTPFTFTRDGSLFISLKRGDVPTMIGDMAGRGPFYGQETGIIKPGRIYIQDLLGSFPETLGKKDIRFLQKRLKDIATKFKEMGLAEDTVLDVRTPFSVTAWESMYGSRTTLGDVLSPEWKLTVPDFLRDTPIRPAIDDAIRVAGISPPNFKNPNQRLLWDRLTKDFDAGFVEAAAKGIDVRYIEGWFPRFLSEAARDAINSQTVEWAKSLGNKVFRYSENFTRQREFTDLRTREYNNFFAGLKELSAELKGKGLNPDAEIGNVLDYAREQYNIHLTPDKARYYLAIAEAIPDGSKFFIENPIIAAHLYNVQLKTAILRKEVIDSFKNHGVSFTGSIEEYKALKTKVGSTYDALNVQKQKLLDRRNRIEQEIENLKANPDVRLNNRRADLEKAHGEVNSSIAGLQAKQDEIWQKAVAEHGPVIRDIDEDIAYISGEDAARLVRDGALDPGDIAGSSDGVFARVPLAKYSNKLEAGGAKISLFPKEARPVIDRFFSLQERTGFTDFLQTYDKINSLYKAVTLFTRPAFYTRNYLSLMLMSWTAGVTDTRDFTTALMMSKIAQQFKAGHLTEEAARQSLQDISIHIPELGVSVDGASMWDEMVHRGVFTGGFYVNEFLGTSYRTKYNDLIDLLRKKGDASLSSEGLGGFGAKATAKGAGLNAKIENHFRVAGFLNQWRKTGSFDEAEKFVKKVYYDYGDLNFVEKNFAKRVIPFYSWLRFNTPRMLETMVTSPAVHLRFASLMSNIERGALNGLPADEEGLPDYFRDNIGVILYRDKQGKYFTHLSDGVFPFVDAYKIFSGEGFAKTIVDGITPFLKFPVEQYFNVSSFTRGQIEDFPGQAAKSQALANLGLTRAATSKGPLGLFGLLVNESAIQNFLAPVKTAANLLDDALDEKYYLNGEPSPGVALFDLFLGRGMVVNPANTRKILQMKKKEFVNKLKKAEETYTKAGNQLFADNVKQMRFYLQMTVE